MHELRLPLRLLGILTLSPALLACSRLAGSDDDETTEAGETGPPSTSEGSGFDLGADPNETETETETDTDTDTDTGTETGETPDCADPNDPSVPVEFVDADIDEDTVWTCDRIWRVAHATQVFVHGANLRIEPGTTVQFEWNAGLVIEKDARLDAVGAANAPIVLTSAADRPEPGDWLGLAVLGRAQVSPPQDDWFPVGPSYGGDDDEHDCGSLAYLRIEYASGGIAGSFASLALLACGSDTRLDHVQVRHSLDDGIEWHGGSMTADHLVIVGAQDDALDVDLGFRGVIQHVVVIQDPSVGDNCAELGSSFADPEAEPRTEITLCNLSCVGSGPTGENSTGIEVKDGVAALVSASILTELTLAGYQVRDPSMLARFEAGDLELRDSWLWANGEPEFSTGASGIDPALLAAWALDPSRANVQADPGLASTDPSDPDVRPSAQVSAQLAPAPGCEPTTYVGAVDPEGPNWAQADWLRY